MPQKTRSSLQMSEFLFSRFCFVTTPDDFYLPNRNVRIIVSACRCSIEPSEESVNIRYIQQNQEIHKDADWQDKMV